MNGARISTAEPVVGVSLPWLHVFQALEEARIRFCILRALPQASAPGESIEIDVLLASGDLDRAEAILTSQHFAAVPTCGRAPHHFFVTYDRTNGNWIKLDVVTDLRYGQPIAFLQIDLADHCLQNRRQHSQMSVLTPEDEFLTLLLHCLLDKRAFPERHRGRLLELREILAFDPSARLRASRLVEKYLRPAVSWSRLWAALNAQDWESLLDRRLMLSFCLGLRDPVRAAWRKLRGRALMLARPLLFAVQCRGISVALLAPDGAGKTTLAQTLEAEPHLRAHRIYLGWGSSGNAINSLRSGELPTLIKSAKTLSHGQGEAPTVRKALRFGNRLLERWHQNISARYQRLLGRTVIFDRYVYDSKLSRREQSVMQRLRSWLLNGGWPEPDLVLVLDAPGEVLFQRKREHSPEWLEQRRLAYLELSRQLPRATVIDATRDAEEVRREATSLIWEQYRVRKSVKDNHGHGR